MEPLSPVHLISPTTTEEQKGINRETSIVELPPTNAVGQDDEPAPPKPGDRGDSTDGTPSVAAAPAISASTPQLSSAANTLSSPVQHYSPTQTEIDAHLIRQRLSIHGDHIAAAGRGTRDDDERPAAIAGPQRQDEPQPETGRERKDNDKMTEVKEGDKVAWNWGGGAPGGVASAVVTDGDATMVSHRGNEVKKHGSPDDPAVHIDRPGNDVVKKASELEVEEKGPGHSDGAEKKDEEKKDDDAKPAEDEKKDDPPAEEKKDEAATNGEAKTGEKRSADEANKDDDAAPKENGDAAEPPKKKGRPAKSGGAAAAKKETKKKQPKPAATADGKPRRSGRNKS